MDAMAGTIPLGARVLGDERDLVLRARTDPAEFGRLYEIHAPAVAEYVLRRTGDTHAAEDLVAEVFVIALGRIGRFQWREIPVRHWFLRIATRQVTKWTRRRRHDRLDAEPAADPRGPAPDDAAAAAVAALAAVPARFQEPLALHYLAGLSLEEIGRALRCPVGTVKSRIARGRDALRAAFSRRSRT